MTGKVSEVLGHTWYELDLARLSSGHATVDYPTAEARDLHALYPLPDRETIQTIWDGRKTGTHTSGSVEIGYTVLNSSAEAGTIHYHPGWGVSALTPIGARAALTMAAIHPDYTIVVPEEATGMPASVRDNCIEKGDLERYSSYYGRVGNKYGHPDIQIGHSRGGVIAANIALTQETSLVVISDTPMNNYYVSASLFAARIGLHDNIRSIALAKGHDRPEDTLLESIVFANTREKLPKNPSDQYGMRRDRGPIAMLGKFVSEYWLVSGLAKANTMDVLGRVLKEENTEIFIAHGAHNIGVPAENVRDGLTRLWYSIPAEKRNKLHYLESPSAGHYPIGHTARIARIARHSIDSIN